MGQARRLRVRETQRSHQTLLAQPPPPPHEEQEPTTAQAEQRSASQQHHHRHYGHDGKAATHRARNARLDAPSPRRQQKGKAQVVATFHHQR